jgi:hypothetical protein
MDKQKILKQHISAFETHQRDRPRQCNNQIHGTGIKKWKKLSVSAGFH